MSAWSLLPRFSVTYFPVSQNNGNLVFFQDIFRTFLSLRDVLICKLFTLELMSGEIVDNIPELTGILRDVIDFLFTLRDEMTI